MKPSSILGARVSDRLLAELAICSGPDADIDSDGDGRPAGDTEWTELYFALRDGTDRAQIHIERVSDFPLILEIRSFVVV